MIRLRSYFPMSGLRGELVRAGTVGFILRILAVLAGLFSSVMLARVLGPSGYGVYAFALAIISILALPVQLGLPTLVVRETARAAATDDWPLVRGLWIWATRVILLASVGLVGAFALWLWGFSELEPVQARTLAWGLLLIPLLAIAAVRGSALLGLRKIFWSTFPDQVFRPVLLASMVGVAALIGAVDAATAMALYVVASTAAFIIGTIALWYARPEKLRQTRRYRSKGKEWLQALIPLSLIVGLQIVNQNTDLLILGILRSSEEVGLYRVALSLNTLMIFGLVAVYFVIQPYLVNAHALGQHDRLQKLVSAAAAISTVFGIVALIVIWVAGELVINLLFGSGFTAAHAPLVVLAIAGFVHAVFGMAGGTLTMTGNERLILRVSIAAALANIIGNLILVPQYGIIGAATATAISITFAQITMYVVALRFVKIDGTVLGIIRNRKANI